MPIPIDKLVRTKRRTIALIIEHNGGLTVRAPLHMPDDNIRAFIDSQQDWIIRNRQKALKAAPVAFHRYEEGERFYFLGKTYPLILNPLQRPSLTFDGAAFRLSRSLAANGDLKFERWYRHQAAILMNKRVPEIAARFGFNYSKIRISKARTRWGSCSSRGTLSFTYRLVMAPSEVVDYVIVHELVHTRIRNHSPRFWAKLGELMPDYKDRLSWLKENGKYLR